MQPLITLANGDGSANNRDVLIIEAGHRLPWLREVWQYRELLYVLTARDIRVRYKQTILGVAWAVLQPLAMMVVFSVFFGRLAAVPSDGVPYPLFAFIGLLPWSFFANAVAASSNSLLGNSALITKIYFPRMIIPVASVGAAFVDLAIGLVLLVPLAIYYGTSVSVNLLLLPLLILLTGLMAIGVGLGMASLSVKYRDVRHALPFALQLLLFTTPVIFPSSIVPVDWRWMLMANPLSSIVEGFRSAILATPVNTSGLAISAILIVGILLLSVWNFRRMERGFADLV